MKTRSLWFKIPSQLSELKKNFTTNNLLQMPKIAFKPTITLNRSYSSRTTCRIIHCKMLHIWNRRTRLCFRIGERQRKQKISLGKTQPRWSRVKHRGKSQLKKVGKLWEKVKIFSNVRCLRHHKVFQKWHQMLAEEYQISLQLPIRQHKLRNWGQKQQEDR